MWATPSQYGRDHVQYGKSLYEQPRRHILDRFVEIVQRLQKMHRTRKVDVDT